MKKRTHLIFAVLLFIMLNGIFSLSFVFAVAVAIGALMPDLDFFSAILHRKLLHNVWALGGLVAAGLYFALIDTNTAFAFSIGYLSHLVADAVTPHGVKPLWPIQQPHIAGPIRTGSSLEFMIAMILLLAIGFVTGFVQLRVPF